jgi:hypothetical protein
MVAKSTSLPLTLFTGSRTYITSSLNHLFHKTFHHHIFPYLHGHFLFNSTSLLCFPNHNFTSHLLHTAWCVSLSHSLTHSHSHSHSRTHARTHARTHTHTHTHKKGFWIPSVALKMANTVLPELLENHEHSI